MRVLSQQQPQKYSHKGTPILGHPVLRHPFLILLIIWLLASIFNFTKAVHIDDSAYLENAKGILANPLHPMSVLLNWENTLIPIYQYNLAHPPLWPYTLALAISVLGESDLLLHLFFSLFTLGAIFFFYRIADKLSPKFSLYLTAIFALGPAFIPSQNLMTDIPTVALWLAFFYLLLFTKRYFLASILIAIAFLIKYTSFVLIPIFFIALILKKDWKTLFSSGFLLFLAFSMYGLLNYFDYGNFHLFNRSVVSTSSDFWDLFNRITVLIVNYIFVAPFTVLFIPVLKKSKVLTFSFSWVGKIIFSWLLITSAYFIFFLPFMAVRHFLLIIPPILFILGIFLNKIKIHTLWLTFTLLFTMSLGVSLGVSDWISSDIYRSSAKVITKRIQSAQDRTGMSEKNIWFAGHWGWQWYAKKEGMKHYDYFKTDFNDGDILIVPKIESQGINPKTAKNLQKIETIKVPSTFLTFVRLMYRGPYPRGFYSSVSMADLPWIFTKEPLEEFTIFGYKTR